MATRERTEERAERTETPDGYKPRLKEQYNNELRAQLKDELDVSLMRVPRLQKITLNMGVGEAKNDAKQLDSAAKSRLSTSARERRSSKPTSLSWIISTSCAPGSSRCSIVARSSTS